MSGDICFVLITRRLYSFGGLLDEPAADSAIDAFVGFAIFPVEVQEGLRVEGVVAFQTHLCPVVDVAVGLGGKRLQKYHGAVAEVGVGTPLPVGEHDGNDGIDDDGVDGLLAKEPGEEEETL